MRDFFAGDVEYYHGWYLLLSTLFVCIFPPKGTYAAGWIIHLLSFYIGAHFQLQSSFHKTICGTPWFSVCAACTQMRWYSISIMQLLVCLGNLLVFHKDLFIQWSYYGSIVGKCSFEWIWQGRTVLKSSDGSNVYSQVMNISPHRDKETHTLVA